MSEEKFYELERLHDKIYEETQEYGRTQFVSRIADLQQENQKLKEELDEARDNVDYYSNVYWEKCEVLDEIREYINNYDVFKEFSFPLMKRDEENQVKSSIDYEFQTSIKKSLLQILDKVKQ